MLGKAFGAMWRNPPAPLSRKKTLTDAFTADGPTLIEVPELDLA